MKLGLYLRPQEGGDSGNMQERGAQAPYPGSTVFSWGQAHLTS